MWKLSFIMNRLLTGRQESFCASLYRNNPDSKRVKVLNRLFSCDENHCEKSYKYWDEINGTR